MRRKKGNGSDSSTQQLVGILSAAFPDQAWGEQTAMAYVRALEDIPTEILTEAIERVARTSTVRPSIATVRHAAFAECVSQVSAKDAWIQLRRALIRTTQPTKLHPAVARTINALGGKEVLAKLREEELHRLFYREWHRQWEEWTNSVIAADWREWPVVTRAGEKESTGIGERRAM